VDWIDVTAPSQAWLQQRLVAMEAAPPVSPALGPHLLLGDAFLPMFRDVMRNLDEERVVVVQGVFERI
jgi:hypothetical protein